VIWTDDLLENNEFFMLLGFGAGWMGVKPGLRDCIAQSNNNLY
jgi:hypothetical protein